MSFSDADEEKLINLVAKHPIIYDTGHADYRNILVKENVWKTIEKELMKSSEDCKKKWKFIRDGYQRFKKKNKLGTGSIAPKNSKDKRHQQLMFLESVSQHKTGSSNISANIQEIIENLDDYPEIDEDLDDNVENTEMQESDDEIVEGLNNTKNTFQEDITEKPKEKRQRRRNYDEVIHFLKERDEKRQILLQTVVKRKDDDIELFSRHIAEVLRSLPPVYKAEAKKDLSVILSNYEIKAAKNYFEPEIVKCENTEF